MTVAAVVIGRNEGTRLVRCLEALSGEVPVIVYVDSGSTDGSVEMAEGKGVQVVALDMSRPFTAARARNTGAAHLSEAITYIQFIDGDCTLQKGWIDKAHDFLKAHPDVAIAAGRLREEHPEASIYNRLCDGEWDTPIGKVKSCGGIAMVRRRAFEEVNGFDARLIAGEEPELCVRLRKQGWKIWRIDADMAFHDAALTRFGQWWQRARRGGYACVQGAAMHGGAPERHNVWELKHMVLWGLVLPGLTLLGLIVTPWALLLLLIWPAQMLRRRLRGDDWVPAVFITLAKIPEAQGVLTYLWRRLTGSAPRLIEYK